MKILIHGGKLVDPAAKAVTEADLRIENGKIAGTGSDPSFQPDREIDASGCYVMPGFIDLHVHLRDPGQTYKETVETGCAAAAAGGFTTIFAMPNTKPVADGTEVIRYVEDKAKAFGKTRVHQIGSVTMGQEGKELADYPGMQQAGCIAISEDGKSVMDSGVYREAMRYAAAHDLLIMAHCEDKNLVQGGVMNMDEKAEELGLKGISNAVEDIIVARDILLAKETGCRLHLCHCSTADSVRMVQAAKKDGVRVTAEVCPHHFSLCTDDIPENDGNYKMNPPLRSKEDRDTLRYGLSQGIMDAISTDHAPHAPEEKNCPMEKASFGIVGLETAACLTWTNLVETGYLTPLQMAEKMSLNPARIAKIPGGSLGAGNVADITIIDTEHTYTIDPSEFASKGRNTPFAGQQVRGRVLYTIRDGEVIFEKGEQHD